MPEISQQVTDVMNYLWHERRILYYMEDTITKANIDSVESNQEICAVWSSYTRYLSLSHTIDKLDSHP
jgi:hypothetical protein